MIAKRPYESTNNLHAARFHVVLLSFFCVLLSVGFKEVRAASWVGTCQGPSCDNVRVGLQNVKTADIATLTAKRSVYVLQIMDRVIVA